MMSALTRAEGTALPSGGVTLRLHPHSVDHTPTSGQTPSPLYFMPLQ